MVIIYIYMDTYIIVHCICISPYNYSLGKSYIYHIITYNDCIYLGKFHHDLTSFDHLALESWLGFRESSPFMAARFRFVKYHNLPRYLLSLYVIIWYMYVYICNSSPNYSNYS
jgi:hypothetical protein